MILACDLGTKDAAYEASSLFIDFLDELAPKATIFFIYLLLCDPSQNPFGLDVLPQLHIGLSLNFIYFLTNVTSSLISSRISLSPKFSKKEPDLNLTL